MSLDRLLRDHFDCEVLLESFGFGQQHLPELPTPQVADKNQVAEVHLVRDSFETNVHDRDSLFVIVFIFLNEFGKGTAANDSKELTDLDHPNDPSTLHLDGFFDSVPLISGCFIQRDLLDDIFFVFQVLFSPNGAFFESGDS